MKIAVGCDDAGEPLLSIIEEWLNEQPDVEVVNFK